MLSYEGLRVKTSNLSPSPVTSTIPNVREILYSEFAHAAKKLQHNRMLEISLHLLVYAILTK